MPNKNNPLQNPLAKIIEFKTIFNEEIFDEGYEVVCSDPNFVTKDVPRGGVIRLGANSNTGVYYLRFYMPNAADIPSAELNNYKDKIIMVYCMKPWTYNGVVTTGYDPINYDGFADFTTLAELNTTRNEITGRSFSDRLKEWITQTSISSGSNAASLPAGNKTLSFTLIGKTTRNRDKMKTFTIQLNHYKPIR